MPLAPGVRLGNYEIVAPMGAGGMGEVYRARDLEGQSLDRHVVPGGLPVERVVELGIALADALAAAHEKGIVHRDLSPAAVLAMVAGPGASTGSSSSPQP